MPNSNLSGLLKPPTLFIIAILLALSGSIIASTTAWADGSPNCSENATLTDAEVSLDWCARDGERHVPPKSTSLSDPAAPASIYYTTRTVESGVGYNCVPDGSGGQTCFTDTNSCGTGANYEISNDTIGIPQAGPPPDPEEMVLVAVIRVDTEADTEEHVAFDCRPVSEANSTSAAEPVVITVTQRDFASMPVTPLEASAGPPDGWLPVNMLNVLYADPEEQVLETELLDTPVAVRATPSSYHWDLGDGNTITTNNPGEPYPSTEISATYTQEGWYDITLTTTFSGQFSVEGGPWQDIDGTIEVASEPIPLYSKSLESRLVNSDVPVDEDEDPWIPPRTPQTDGPKDRDATDLEL